VEAICFEIWYEQLVCHAGQKSDWTSLKMHLGHDLECLAPPRRPLLTMNVSFVYQCILVEVDANLVDSRREVSPRRRQPPWNARRYRSKTMWPPSIPRQEALSVADSAPKSR
jgi:hypothetical protein